jgi:CheY-like chemotaxis protein
MSRLNLLIIDDERMMHVVFKALLGQEYNLLFAQSAQEGIDILAEETVNLILLDIQMPQLSGIELLESIMIDASLRSIPVVIITGKATDELEHKARKLGATDFFTKEVLLSDKKTALRNINKNVSPNVKPVENETELKKEFQQIIKAVIKDRFSGDFITAGRKLGTGIINSLQVDYFSLWTIKDNKTNLILALGDRQPEDFGPNELLSEEAFREFADAKKPYLSNHPLSGQKGMFADQALRIGLSSEVGVPLFSITKEELVNNDMNIPAGTPLYGFIIIKRNRVFTTKEFNLLSTFIIQTGTVLYGMYRELFQY